MALNPSYIYPNRPMHFKGKNDDLGIGVSIGGNMPPNPNGWIGTDLKISFVDVRTIDLTGFPNTELDKVVFTFSNDTELHFKTKIDNNVIHAKMTIEYQGTEIFNFGGWKPRSLDQLPLTFWGDLKNCKFYCSTSFYQPVENVTEANGVYFNVMIPAGQTKEVPFGTICDTDLHQVTDGNTAWVGTDICWAETNIIEAGYPDHYRTGIGTWEAPISNPPYDFYIENLENFNTIMKTAGKGTGGKDIYDNDPDPAGGDDPSGPGGGGGNYDPTSDPVDFPSLPTGGALTSGMLKGFVVSSLQLEQMQQKLWDMSIFDITTQFQKLVNQPLDCLISLHALPLLPVTGSSEVIKLGSFDTTVQGLRITNQYKVVDAGSITVPLFWGSALDYAPYTRCEIFIPFVGFRNLQIEDIQGQTLNLKYNVDVLTGDCVAYLKCGQSVLYSFTGNCLQHIPCMASSSDLLAKNISAVGMVGVGIATGNPAAAVAGAASGAINSATAKNHVQRSGEVAGSPGIMSDFTPYLVFHRPKQSLAKNYNRFKGYPSNITYTLSSLSGYTEVEHVHLTGISGATDTELQEIENLLKEGVII